MKKKTKKKTKRYADYSDVSSMYVYSKICNAPCFLAATVKFSCTLESPFCSSHPPHCSNRNWIKVALEKLSRLLLGSENRVIW